MDHAISIEESVTRATPNERLEALKARYVPTPNNQQQLEDGDLNKIMDPHLYVATEKGDVEKFMDALEKVCELRKLALSQIFDQVTPSGNSLLHVAASSGREDVMELILFHYPDLMTWKNSSEDTPLHVAVHKRRLEATRKLIHLRGDSEIMYWKNKDSKSPLYLAAETGDMEILGLLVEASARDEDYAAKIQGKSPVFAALEEGKLGILREIIDRLPKLLHVRNEDGGTPLHSAASVGNVGVVKLLLKKCPYLAFQTDKDGSYPIHIACQEGTVDIVRELVETWLNLAEIKNNRGQNILHVAAKTGNDDIVKSLLEVSRKAVMIEELMNSKDVDGNTPRDLALMHSHCQVVRPSDDIRSELQLLNNGETAAVVAMESRSSPPSHHEGSIGRDLRSTREQSSGANESSRLELMKEEIDARLLVATLVASVTFTASITLPGGYNSYTDPNPGMPTLLHNPGFQVFIIFDVFAAYSSILSVLVLLQARSGNRQERESSYEFAGAVLPLAVIFMTVAFSASSIVAVSKIKWLKIFFWCFGVYYGLAIYICVGIIFD